MLVGCPFLEDEMVYNISHDSDWTKLFVLQNSNIKTLLPKLEKAGMEFKQISERDFFRRKYVVPDHGYSIIIWMMDPGLHSEPENLSREVRKSLLKVPGLADGIALYYGLCGRGMEGIREWGKENLPIPLTIFADKEGNLCDDCICVPLGSSTKYLELMKKHTGVMYLTPAVACNWGEFNKHSELMKGSYRIGMEPDEFMKMMFEMAGYEKCLKIQTGIGDQENFQRKCEEFADNMNLELVDLEDGWVSQEAVERLHSEARSFLFEDSVSRGTKTLAEINHSNLQG